MPEATNQTPPQPAAQEPQLNNFDNWDALDRATSAEVLKDTERRNKKGDEAEADIMSLTEKDVKPRKENRKKEEDAQDAILTLAENEGKKKKEPKEDSTAPDADKAEFKRVKAKTDQGEIEIPEEATFSQKVNGKAETVKLADLLSNWAGKQAWDRRFADLSKWQKEMEATEAKHAEKATLESKQKQRIKMAMEDFSKGHYEDAFEQLAEIGGLNGEEIKGNVRKLFDSYAEQKTSMSPEEWRNLELQRENETLKRSREREKIQREHEMAQNQFEARENAVMSQYGITKRDILLEVGRFNSLKNLGEIPPDVVPTPELIGKAVFVNRVNSLISEHLPKVLPEKAGDANFIAAIQQKAIENPQYSLQDWLEIAQMAREEMDGEGKSRGGNALDKRMKNSPDYKGNSGSSHPSTYAKEPTSWDSVDSLLR